MHTKLHAQTSASWTLRIALTVNPTNHAAPAACVLGDLHNIKTRYLRTFPHDSALCSKWRRVRDSNSRYKFPRIHAFQACSFNHSDNSPQCSTIRSYSVLLPCRVIAACNDIYLTIPSASCQHPFFSFSTKKSPQISLRRLYALLTR